MSGNGEHLFPLSFGFFILLLEAKLQVDLHQLLRGVQPVEPLLSQLTPDNPVQPPGLPSDHPLSLTVYTHEAVLKYA